MALKACVVLAESVVLEAAAVLPSWSEGASKVRIVDFIKRVTDKDSAEYLPPSERILVTDNDGTLWTEKPLYPQVAYYFDRVMRGYQKGELDIEDPLYRAVLEKDYGFIKQHANEQLIEGLGRLVEGMTLEDFQRDVYQFLNREKHPRYGQAYSEMVYQPMLELVELFRQHQFQIYIVTGGGENFVASVSESLYRVPKSQVIGTRTQNRLADDGVSVIKGRHLIGALNEHQHKVNNIQERIGQKPVVAIGNSNGDLEMLQYVADTPGPSLAMLIQHDDNAREFAYSKRAESAQQRASQQGWLAISVATDFKRVFAFQ